MSELLPARKRAFRIPNKSLLGLLKTLTVIASLIVAVFFSAPTMPWLIVGVAIMTLGEGVRIWSAGHLVRNQQLATGGPYAYTRNPLYLGRLLLILGFSALVWGYAGLALLLVGLGYFFVFYMPRKESKEPERLARIFGDEYFEYHKTVPSLLPRFTPYPKARGRWCWETFLGNQEHLMALFVLACVLAVILKWWHGIPR